MRNAALVFLLAATAAAGEFVDKPTGLKLTFPDDWRRDSSREEGAIKFSGFLAADRDKGSYLTLTVEAIPLMEAFDKKAWLAHEQKSKTKILNKSVTQEFTAEDVRIGGLDSVGYVIGGVATPKDQDVAVRFRVRAVVHGSHFFKITEVSVNKAHEARGDALKEIWNGIQFQAAEGGGDGGGSGLQPVKGEPTEAVDKAGNYKVKLPPGWIVEREAPDDKNVELRMVFMRKDADDNPICVIQVWRMKDFRPQLISSGTPDEVVQNLLKRKYWEAFYGEGSSDVIRADVDEGVGFGSAERSGEYTIRSKTMEEIKKIADAETLQRRGDKNIKVPEYLDLVMRGRVAIISPAVYITRCQFRRSLADDAQLVAEYKQVHENLSFLVSEALPQALNIGGDVGNTVDNPAFAKDRKEKIVHDVRSARRTYRMELKFTLPAGFARYDKKLPSDQLVMVVYAQDGKNNWIRISMIAVNQKKRVDDNPGKIVSMPDPDKDAEQWKSNWTGTARGLKVPSNLKKFSLGRIRGEGYDGLSGDAKGFRAKFWGIASSKTPGKGWYILVDVETRGDGDKLFEDKMKKMFKSMKVKDVKVK